MKLKRNLSQLVQTDYTPLVQTKEGQLRGGFGAIDTGIEMTSKRFNIICKNDNCGCTKPSTNPTNTINPTTTPPIVPTTIPTIQPTL